MIYKVEFESGADAVSYKVKAENVLDAEELAKKKLKNDMTAQKLIWKVKYIENIKEA
jgi:hypothetical protein|tara:strand:+ start:173 stop:343 length:171 start_codon:yes stop_codon:yes gene_type:complete